MNNPGLCWRVHLNKSQRYQGDTVDMLFRHWSWEQAGMAILAAELLGASKFYGWAINYFGEMPCQASP